MEEYISVFKNLGIKNSTLELVGRTIKPLRILKGETFIFEGKTQKKIGILVSGILKSVYSDESGDRHVAKFYYQDGDQIVVDYKSFLNGSPANETIIAIENSVILTISKIELDRIFLEDQSMKDLARNLAEESYLNALERIKQLQLSSKVRVEHFHKKHPKLIRFVSVKDRASYLGMHRNNYSKWANKI